VKECVSFGFAAAVLDGSPNGLAVWPLVLAAGNIAKKERHNRRRDILMLLNTEACHFCSRTVPRPPSQPAAIVARNADFLILTPGQVIGNLKTAWTIAAFLRRWLQLALYFWEPRAKFVDQFGGQAIEEVA
jgi:hypothetical protein